MLIGARFVQGVGGALTSAVILGMIVTMFPEPREQAKAIGVYTFVAVAGGSIGLLVGGALTEAISWHWIFFVNLPIGVATGLAALRLVEGREGIGLGQGADVPGAVLLTGGLMLFVYTILEVEQQGWGSVQTLAMGSVAIALLAVFLVRQSRTANPLMPLRLFRSRIVSGANLVQAHAGGRDVRDVLPGRALHAADPRLRPARGGPRLPADDARDGHDVVPRLRPAQHALRTQGHADPQHGGDRRGHAAVRTHAGRGLLRRRPAAADGAASGSARGSDSPR